jgi:hypothetical protein
MVSELLLALLHIQEAPYFRRMLSYGVQRLVVRLESTDVSDELVAFVFGGEE